MKELAEIIHNLNDHALVLLRLLNEKSVAPDIVERLNSHILLEEEENYERLLRLNNLSPSSLIIRKALDHSYLIKRMIQEDVMPLELKLELLDHFVEEQEAWMLEISPDGSNRKWTVGPMCPQQGG